MSTKPSTVPTWASTATGIARTVDPGGTVRGDGWNVDDRPPAGWFNWLLNTAGLWFQYLSDQVFTGDVESTGNFITPSADVVHGTRTLIFDAASLIDTFGGATRSTGAFDVAAGAFGEALCPLDLAVGQRILAVRVIGETDNGAASDINARLSRTVAAIGDATGTQSYIVALTNLQSSDTLVNQVVLTPGSPELVDYDRSYCVRMNFQNTGGGTGKRVYRVEVDVDRIP